MRGWVVGAVAAALLGGCGILVNDAPPIAREQAALDWPMPEFARRSDPVADPGPHLDDVDWTRARRLHVLMVDYAFAPGEMAFERGQPYRLRIRNLGDRRHIFSAPDFFRAIAIRRAEPMPADSPGADPAAPEPSVLIDATGSEIAYLTVVAAARLRGGGPARAAAAALEEMDAEAEGEAGAEGETGAEAGAMTPAAVELTEISWPLQAIVLEPRQVAEVDFVPVHAGVYYVRSGFANVRGMHARIRIE